MCRKVNSIINDDEKKKRGDYQGQIVYSGRKRHRRKPNMRGTVIAAKIYKDMD